MALHHRRGEMLGVRRHDSLICCSLASILFFGSASATVIFFSVFVFFFFLPLFIDGRKEEMKEREEVEADEPGCLSMHLYEV